MSSHSQVNSPEYLFNEYQHLASTTLKRVLHNPQSVAQSNLIEYNDLLQYAFTGLWQACLNHDATKSSFQTHAINNIRWSVFDGLNRECSMIKYDVNNPPSEEDMYLIESIDAPVDYSEGESMSYHETISDDVDIEKIAFDKMISNKLLDTLSERDRLIIHMKSMDATNREIAEKIGVSTQAADKAYKRIQREMRKEDIK